MIGLSKFAQTFVVRFLKSSSIHTICINAWGSFPFKLIDLLIDLFVCLYIFIYLFIYLLINLLFIIYLDLLINLLFILYLFKDLLNVIILKQAPPKKVPKTIENMRVFDETVVSPADQEVSGFRFVSTHTPFILVFSRPYPRPVSGMDTA